MPAFGVWAGNGGMCLKTRSLFRAGGVLLGLFCVCAAFEAEAADGGGQVDPPDLYVEAMRALSERRVDDARAALLLLIEKQPESPGAWLDLATLRCSLGDAAEAERLFLEIEDRFSPPEAIREVISHQRVSGCSGPQRRYSATLRVGRGFDNNANQGATNPYFSIGSGIDQLSFVLLPEYLPRSDHYSALSFEAHSPDLFSGSVDGFFQFRAREYDNLNKVDSVSMMGGVERGWRIGAWDFRGGGSFTATTLGGNHYLNQGSLQLQSRPPFDLPKGWEFWVFGGGSLLRYPSYSQFDGNLFEMGGAWRFANARSSWSLNVGGMVDRKEGDRPGGSRSGYFAGTEGKFLLPHGCVGEVALLHQSWRSEDVYSPGLIDVRRRQNTSVFKTGVAIPVASGHSIHAEYLYTNNRENISLFEYSGYLIQLSWQYRFGRP